MLFRSQPPQSRPGPLEQHRMHRRAAASLIYISSQSGMRHTVLSLDTASRGVLRPAHVVRRILLGPDQRVGSRRRTRGRARTRLEGAGGFERGGERDVGGRGARLACLQLFARCGGSQCLIAGLPLSLSLLCEMEGLLVFSCHRWPDCEGHRYCSPRADRDVYGQHGLRRRHT